MTFDDFFIQYQQMTRFKILLSFKGVFSQPALVEMGNTIRNTLNTDSVISNIVMKKVFAIFIELSQNILHYSAETELDLSGKEQGVGILIVFDREDRFCITSGNLIPNDSVERIRERCELVSNLSKDELKDLYNKQRKSERPTDSKGAGLGFIDMARKSDFPLEYEIRPYNEKFSFFMLSSYISKGQ